MEEEKNIFDGLNRLELAILAVLFETHPLGLTEEEIMQRIEEKGLLEMTDEEFNNYRHNSIKAKQN
jgi:hypothetical protein